MSVVKKDRLAIEHEMILERHGPRSIAGRLASRLLLKTWVNATHPEWLASKLLDRMRVRLGFKELSYFD